MNRLLRYLNKSITRRFIAMMLIALSLIMVGAGTVFWRAYDALTSFQNMQEDLKDKEQIVSEIADHTTQVFFRARGYYAFLNKMEYEEVFKEKEKLFVKLNTFKQMPLNETEKNLVQSIELFIGDFISNVFPKASKFVENNDYESLHKFSSSGINNAVNDLISYADQFKRDNVLMLDDQNQAMIKDIFKEGVMFAAYVLGILMLSVWIAARTAKDIGKPLGELSAEAESYTLGKSLVLDYMEREDEIGKLSRSLHYMMIQIGAKESELLAQNEELIAQQDELQMQQEELQRALSKMEENERYLEKRNSLIQSLSNTLDKKGMIERAIRNTVEISDTDKGLLVLLNSEKEYAAFGISDEGIAQFIRELDNGMLTRVSETKEPYLVTRCSERSEKGYHTEDIPVYDLYIPIVDAGNNMMACLVLTRIGRQITKNEQLELNGLAAQLSLSLERIAMFEEKERQRQMTQDMLNTIQEGVQLLATDGTTLQVNRMMCEIMGCEESFDMSGLKFDQYLEKLKDKVDDFEGLKQFILDIVEMRPAESQSYVYRLSELDSRYILVYYEPLFRKQERIGTLLVHRDITREYEVDQMKSEFVSTVSHELRTPLASVLGFTELLLNKELKPERQKKYLTTIHQEAKRLTSLINDFLDLQRMESGRQIYHFVSIDVSDLIQETLNVYGIEMANHRIIVEEMSEKYTIVGDKDKLHQALINLLSNAVKYSPAGGTITITAYKNSRNMYLEIKDEGLGIPEDAIPNLFTKFFRIDNSDRREIGGTGLGLAIVKEIVTVHGGEVAVRSLYGQGSTFTIKLPLSASQLSNAKWSPADFGTIEMNPSIATIYIIEDDLNISELMRDELQEKGFCVRVYMNGEEALQAMQMSPPDAVVIDLILGSGNDGWSIIAQMRNDANLKNVPVIICSAYEEMKRAAAWGVNEYLIKPFHPHRLSEAVLKVLSDENTRNNKKA